MAAAMQSVLADSTFVGLDGSCTSQAFSFPNILGAELLAVRAEVKTNYTLPASDTPGTDDPDAVIGINFCNVSVSYTHPGQGDVINTEVWLPLEGWNGRFRGEGGGGYMTGMYPSSFYEAVSQGFASASTDGGHPILDADEDPYGIGNPYPWALVSPGNVNLYLLQDFASVTLGETATIGKAITETFYGSPPKYSYFKGCSTGGRQGLMLAQRYPNAYDGILAEAPAIYWPTFLTAALFINVITSFYGIEPFPCEYNALTRAAIAECDGKDGVIDGIISAPHLCDLDPFTLVGQEVWCETENRTVKISEAAGQVASTSWAGPKHSDGYPVWFGLTPDAPIAGSLGTGQVCVGDVCENIPSIPHSWTTLWIYKNADANISSLSQKEYESIVRHSTQEYDSIIGTGDPDLSEFRDHGGKMITFHGLADQSIVPGGTKKYYDQVLQRDPSAPDYYRYFEAPGVGHCGRGVGPYPKRAFEVLMEWVENGNVPETLDAESPRDEDGLAYKRPLCVYPLVARYNGSGNVRSAESFECGEQL